MEKESPITFDGYVEYLEKRHDVKYEVYLLSQWVFPKECMLVLKKNRIDSNLLAPRTPHHNRLAKYSGCDYGTSAQR